MLFPRGTLHESGVRKGDKRFLKWTITLKIETNRYSLIKMDFNPLTSECSIYKMGSVVTMM